MIVERERIGKKMATVVYLMNDFSPAPSKDEAEMAKIIYDSGLIQFITFTPPPES